MLGISRTTEAVGGLITLGFGVWHFFIPSMFGWYDYLQDDPAELSRGIGASNFFLSFSLCLIGATSIAFPSLFPDTRSANTVWLWANVGLWTARSIYQVVAPQGTQVDGLSQSMLAGFILTDLLFIFSAVVGSSVSAVCHPSASRKGASHLADRPFPWRKTLILGFGFFGINVIPPLFNSLIPPMLEDLGIAATVIGFIMTWDNIINLFTQPWVGSRSDRTHTQFGRRKPWLMLGAPLAAFFFILVPFVRENFVLLALALLSSHLGIALFRVAHRGLPGDLFRPAERSRSNGVIHLVGGLGSVFALLGGGALYRIGVPLPFIVGAGVTLIAIGIVVAFLKEPDLSEQPASERIRGSGPAPGGSRPIATGAASFCWPQFSPWFTGCSPILAFCTLYARNVLGVPADTSAQMMTVFPAALIVFAIPSGFLATRIGRKPTIITGLGGMVLCSLVGFTLGNPAVLLAVLAAMGAFWALVTINALPMVYDLPGQRSIGAFTGLYYFAASLAAITGPILAGRLIDSTSYRIIWPFCLVFLALAIALITQVRPRRAV